MKKHSWLKKAALFATVLVLAGGIIAWQDLPDSGGKQSGTDTIPVTKKPKDIDQALEQLEQSMTQLEKTLADREWEEQFSRAMKQVDMEKIKADVDAALREIDVTKIQAEVQLALNAANLESLKAQLEKGMSEFDSKKVKEEIERAMKEIDAEKIRAEVETSLAGINMEKIMADVKRLQEVDFQKMQEELKRMGPEVEKSLESARASIDKAKEELLAHKAFLGRLEKDGLISQQENYTIEHKDGELIINGKKQPNDVLKRYQDFLDQHKEFKIIKDDHGFTIRKD